MKKKGRKAFWHNFKFKYKLTITNENTLEEIVGLHVSKLNGVSVLLSAVTVIFLISATIIVFTPLRNYLPGYMNSEVRAQVVTNALRADSLQQVVTRQNMYIMNIQDIFSGKVKADTVQSIDSDPVKGGEAIALVGNTGEKTTGPHLHFELWHKGRAIDPSKYIVF